MKQTNITRNLQLNYTETHAVFEIMREESLDMTSTGVFVLVIFLLAFFFYLVHWRNTIQSRRRNAYMTLLRENHFY